MSHQIDQQHANYISVGAFVDELVRSGVHHFCVCPGSRSTPLALTLARHADARVWMHLDERSAAFFGLGMAKMRREAVALVCTSGTAAANFLPAVIEAYYSRVPLLVITADRPHELRECGAPQTIDQLHLFGRHAKWFFDLEEPDSSAELVRHVRTIACRAVATARQSPPGPVHINCPFREPLIPVAPPEMPNGGRSSGQPYLVSEPGQCTVTADQANRLSANLAAAHRGLIVCGPQDDPGLASSSTALARRLGYPILADPLSGVRCGGHDRALVLDCYDALLRDDGFVDQFIPEVIIRFGAMPTSKPLLLYAQRHPECSQFVVDEAGWNEPTQLATEIVRAEAKTFCDAVIDALPPALSEASERKSWLEAWRRANRISREAVAGQLANLEELFEGKVFAELAELLPEGALLYAGNSMPVRDLDTFFPGNARSVRFLANRGANGIDGVVSAALGAGAGGACLTGRTETSASTGPLVLAIGDLSFCHDSNGLLAARQHRLHATIVLLNNRGGGIFSFLPQATDPKHFETLFGMPHDLDFRPVAEAYGAKYTRVENWPEFRAAVRSGISGHGLHIVEVPTERNRNVVLHREIWRAVSARLAQARDVEPVSR